MSHLSEAGDIVDITISDPPLEEVIAKIYQEAGSQQSPVRTEMDKEFWVEINRKQIRDSGRARLAELTEEIFSYLGSPRSGIAR